MNKHSYNDLYKKQQLKLVRATFKKAFISNVNISANTSDVYFAENPSATIKNIPLATHINASGIMIGDRCRVDVFDETNPNDMVVAYIYGRAVPVQGVVKFTTGNFSFPNGQAIPFNIPHGLGVIPDVFGVMNTAAQNSSSPTATYAWFATVADATNITVDGSTAPAIVGQTLHWFALKF